jgi:hypothetical protein
MEAEEGNEVKLAEKAKNAGEELPADFPQVKASQPGGKSYFRGRLSIFSFCILGC